MDDGSCSSLGRQGHHASATTVHASVSTSSLTLDSESSRMGCLAHHVGRRARIQAAVVRAHRLDCQKAVPRTTRDNTNTLQLRRRPTLEGPPDGHRRVAPDVRAASLPVLSGASMLNGMISGASVKPTSQTNQSAKAKSIVERHSSLDSKI